MRNADSSISALQNNRLRLFKPHEQQVLPSTMGGCISLIRTVTEDTDPVRPPEPVLRFRDPNHPSNQPLYYSQAVAAQQSRYQPNVARLMLERQQQQQQSSISTAASATGNSNVDVAKSDAHFVGGTAMLNGGGQTDAPVQQQQQQLAAHAPPAELKGAASATARDKDKAEDNEPIAFPSSWTRGKLIGQGAFGSVSLAPGHQEGRFSLVPAPDTDAAVVCSIVRACTLGSTTSLPPCPFVHSIRFTLGSTTRPGSSSP